MRLINGFPVHSRLVPCIWRAAAWLLLLVPNSAIAVDVCGVLDTPEELHWTASESPYLLTCDVTVPAREPFSDWGQDGIPGTSDLGEGDGQWNPGEPFTDYNDNEVYDDPIVLVIDAGTIIKLEYVSDGGYGIFYRRQLIVEGAVEAIGSAGSPIVFTSSRDDAHGGDTNGNGPSSGYPGDWSGIIVGGGGSVFEHCEFLYGGLFRIRKGPGFLEYTPKPMVDVSQGNVVQTINECTFASAYDRGLNYSVSTDNGTPAVIANHVFSECPRALTYAGNASTTGTIQDNEFTDCDQGIYATVTNDTATVDVVNNTLVATDGGYGITLRNAGPASVVSGNTVAGYDAGIASNTCSPQVEDNTLNCSGGYPFAQIGASFPSYSGNTFGPDILAGIAVSGSMSASGTWNDIQGMHFPYVLTADLTVASGATLVIPAGTIIKMEYVSTSGLGVYQSVYRRQLIVQGTVEAIGSSGSPIIFTSSRDDAHGGDTNGNGPSSGYPGDWSGIIVGGGGSVFEHCEFLYGGLYKIRNADGHMEYTPKPMVDVSQGNVVHTITECMFANAYDRGLNYSVSTDNGTPAVIANHVFSECPRALTYAGNASTTGSIQDNEFNDCNQGIYATVTNDTATVDVINNALAATDGGYGITLFKAGPTSVVSGNTVAGYDAGIASNTCSPQVEDNTLNCSGGYPFAQIGASFPSYSGNTFGPDILAGIAVSGSMSASGTWNDIQGMHFPYVLTADLTVSAAGSLTISPDLEIQTVDDDNYLNVYGVLSADGVIFANDSSAREIRTYIYSGGIGHFSGCGWPGVAAAWVQFCAGSSGSVECCGGSLTISVCSDASVLVENNDLASGLVVVAGPAGTSVEMPNNYWGTTDLEEIAAKITDCNDNPALPCVEFEPFLLEPPAHCEVPCTGNTLMVDAPDYELWGEVGEYDCIKVINGGNIVVPPATWNGSGWDGGWLSLQADTIYVDSTSSIHADACGFSKDDGHSNGGVYGHGEDFVWDTSHAGYGGSEGAGHGGTGGFCQWTTPFGNGGDEYGSENIDPCTELGDCDPDLVFGSAGGDYICWTPLLLRRGGRGGGYIRLIASTSLTIEGTVSADGGNGIKVNDGFAPPGAGSGGGSGGYVILSSPLIDLTGTVSAKGGRGSDPSTQISSGGGAGGRIIVAGTTEAVCVPDSAVAGGSGACFGPGDGDPGSVYLPTFVTDTPTITGLANDTGRSSSDLVTNDPAITGTAEPDSAIKLFVNGLVVGTGTADGTTGDFSVTITGAVDDGIVEVTATAREPCANESSVSAPFTFTLDTQPPAIPSTPDLMPSSDTGSHDDDDITRDWGPYIQGTCEADMDVMLYEGLTSLGTAYTADGNWQIMSSPLEEGTRLITATAMDAAGNESAQSSALSILVDTTDPVISNMSVVPTDCQTIGQVFTLQATVTDALSGIPATNKPEATIRQDTLTIDHFDLQPVGGNVYRETWDSSGTLAGTYSVDIEARDVAGNLMLVEDADLICLDFAVGDMNCDGWLNDGDIPLFVEALLDPAAFDAAHPNCDNMQADVDTSGRADGGDIGQFVTQLLAS